MVIDCRRLHKTYLQEERVPEKENTDFARKNEKARREEEVRLAKMVKMGKKFNW